MRYCFIHNPGSNHGRSGKCVPYFQNILKAQNIAHDYNITSSLAEAAELSEKANRAGCDCIVAVGGDGTINRVVNGFYDTSGKRLSNARLGVVHTGTSPDFCRSYGIPTEPFAALDTVLEGHTVKISVGKVDYRKSQGNRERLDTRYFSCCANIGLGAAVARYANSGFRRRLGDSSGTLVAILMALITFKLSPIEIVADGKTTRIPRNINTFIGKTDFVASGIKICNNLELDDKRLYVLTLDDVNWRNVVPLLRCIYSGAPLRNSRSLSFGYATSVVIEAESDSYEVEFDGDPQGTLPCTISVAEELLDLIVEQRP
ncbi:MAG: diacylglycerol kinase [Candidatus Cloacimonetes bacterium]|nr:diacylglycerol kinase [Candidatus Cloacimonadota bacterium]